MKIKLEVYLTCATAAGSERVKAIANRLHRDGEVVLDPVTLANDGDPLTVRIKATATATAADSAAG